MCMLDACAAGRYRECAGSSKGLIGTLVEVYQKDGIGKLYSGMQPEITRGCLSAGLVRGISHYLCNPNTPERYAIVSSPHHPFRVGAFGLMCL